MQALVGALYMRRFTRSAGPGSSRLERSVHGEPVTAYESTFLPANRRFLKNVGVESAC